MVRRGGPFRVFPEGFAYTPVNQSKHAMAVISKAPHEQRAAYFPFQIGKMFWHIELEDLSNLIVNAVKWAGHDSELEVEGPTTLHVSLREMEQNLVFLTRFCGVIAKSLAAYGK